MKMHEPGSWRKLIFIAVQLAEVIQQ